MFSVKILIPFFIAAVSVSACASPAPEPTISAPVTRQATAAKITQSTAIAVKPSSTPLPEPSSKATQTPSPVPAASSTPAPTEIPTSEPVTKNFAWTQVETKSSPAARYDHALAFDPDHGQLILFGGRAGTTTFGDTWIFDIDTSTWREIASPGPSARFGLASAYDPKTKAVYLFGGQKSEFYNDTWKFDTRSETWSEIKTEGAKPDIRYGHGVTLDTQNDRLIVSHGFARDGRHKDTWALDLKTNQWTDISPSGDKPLNRCLHDIAYAVTSNTVYLFGGCSSGFGPCPQGDLWALDLASDQWTLLKPVGDLPPARQNPSIVAAPSGNLILFGGKSDKPLDDLWEFNPQTNSWKQVSAQGPGARFSHDAVLDPVHNRVYVFGGQTSQGAVNELWMLNF